MASKKLKSSDSVRKTIGTPKSSPARSELKLGISIATVLLASLLLFWNLGHYALWDDEAGTALHAEGVLRTGDTAAMIGQNLVAFRGGTALRNLRERTVPPLQSYLAAPFFGMIGENALAARLPFAAAGLLAIGIMLLWLWQSEADATMWMVSCLGILGNVSLFLYCRQCRYYGLVILFTVGLAYLYTHWKGRRWEVAAFTVASLLLFSAQYMNYVIICICIAVDFVFWGRKGIKLKVGQIIAMALPLLICGAFLASIWNPLTSPWNTYLKEQSDTVADRLHVFFWTFRDMNSCEFGVGLLLLAAPVLYFLKRDTWLLRGIVAALVYVGLLTMVTPQRNIGSTGVADIRYAIPLIPLFIAMGVRSIMLATREAKWLAIPLAILAFCTNFLNGALFFPENALNPKLRPYPYSTIASYVSELANPPGDPYTAGSKWIDENVKTGESIWVLPDYMAYPLMFRSPQALYAWQLAPTNHDPQFAGLPPIHFQGRVPPDYIMAFGPVSQQVRRLLAGWQNASYEQVATVDCFWKDLFRPELFWRTFQPVTGYNPETDAIYIFKKKS